MADMIHCATHGDSQQAFVCNHLLGDSAGLGFNRGDPTPDNPFPDAWCDDCDIIRAAHGGWNDQSEKLLKVAVLCSACYERVRIRNTRTSFKLDDLANFRWKCGSCEEWHTGPCLDFTYDFPVYWSEENDNANRRARLFPSWGKDRRKTFLDEDYCAIDDESFFVRGVIHLPIIGSRETFRWGVWGSLSRENFEILMNMEKQNDQVELPNMFSWMSTRLEEYPDTVNLKMYAHFQGRGQRPDFELEPTDHLLSREYHHGITPERVKEIMIGRLRGNE
jgi:hypothetical protein